MKAVPILLLDTHSFRSGMPGTGIGAVGNDPRFGSSDDVEAHVGDLLFEFETNKFRDGMDTPPRGEHRLDLLGPRFIYPIVCISLW